MQLSVKNLRVSYGSIEVVKDVSLEINKGDLVSLIGANGAGKTTVLRAISGLQTSLGGEIWFEEQRIDCLRPSEIVKKGISHVPQGRRIFPYLTVQENLLVATHMRMDRKSIEKDIERIFETLPELKRRKQYAGTLSGGEQQMLAIGRSLMQNPKLILMDEPSLGLSPMLVRRIGNLVVTININGVTILLVEQNVALAFSVAKKTYVMETGKIVLEGDSKSVLSDGRVKRAYLGG